MYGFPSRRACEPPAGTRKRAAGPTLGRPAPRRRRTSASRTSGRLRPTVTILRTCVKKAPRARPRRQAA
eukprot:3452453-Pyramimonas_sp.AAC.1